MVLEVERFLSKIERVSDLSWAEITDRVRDEYAIVAYEFVRKYGLKPQDFGWFIPDHIAIKARNLADYLGCLSLFETKCQEIYEGKMDGRKIASAKLFSPLSVGPFGETWRTEFIQPKADKVGRDIVGIEHMEVVCPDLDRVEQKLRRAGIECAPGGDKYHKTRVVKINERGQEIQFTDKGNRQVIAEELVDREVRVLQYGFID